MTITEIQKCENGDVGIYQIENKGKKDVVFEYHDGFRLASKEGGDLREISGSPELLSFLKEVEKGVTESFQEHSNTRGRR